MIKKSKRLLPVVLFGCFYMICFAWLERMPGPYHIISSTLDQKIPFCEYFIVPYFLWFFYIAGTVIFFIFFNEDQEEYWHIMINLALGMTLFLIVSYVYPNGLMIRPTEFPRDNIFVTMVKMLYQSDTSTNVLPSIHVYNSVAVFTAINSCKKLQPYKAVRAGSFVLTTLIVLSTMFLKQHSIPDVATGITFSVASYVMIYKVHARSTAKAKEKGPARS
ncbi:MAG: phosphatase PAP2 family protein [Clostridia bacterium]|nr:phosphatase PAP2 family protein [Clostridia bacterium]NCC44234.1 phosphatase PAP2 family protein [Clostridia bacterium]